MKTLAVNKKTHRKYMLLAFFIPLAIMLLIYFCEGVYPFGGRGVALVDSFHQYVPFFADLQDKLKTGGSFLYSWAGGLGYNFTAVMAYYLMSPFNLLLAFIPKSQVLTLFSTLIAVKISLASLACYFYLSSKFKRDGLPVLAFSLMYAFCSWTIGYNWNIMWLDSLVMLPFLIHALEKLIDGGRGVLYCVLLGITIILNFYIAFAICIFLVLYFFYYYFGRKKISGGEFLRRGFGFAGWSLLGGGLSAAVIIPVYYALQNVYSSGHEFPTQIQFYYNWGDLFTRGLPFTTPTKVTGLPNLYFGVFSIMAVILFAFLKKAHIRKRVMGILLMAFLVFSTNFKILNYIWHGFHFPNDLPGRFTFIAAFLGVAMAAEVFFNIRRFRLWQVVTAYAVVMVLISVSYVMGTGKESGTAYIISAALTSVYFLMIVYINDPVKGSVKLKKAFAVILIGETAANAAFGLAANGTMNRTQYVEAIDTADHVHEMIAEAEEIDRTGSGFYRSEMDEFNGRNNSMWLGFRGMSLFSSTMSEKLQLYLNKLGFFSAANKYSYVGATPVTDALFGMKYVMANKELNVIRTFEKLADVDDKYLYINRDALSVGYMVKESYLDGYYESTNPFTVQNNLVRALTGGRSDVFYTNRVEVPEAEGGTARETDLYTYIVEKDGDGECTAVFTIDLYDNYDHYIYFKARDFDSLKVENENGTRTYNDVRGHIVELGSGGEAVLRLTLSPDKTSGNITLISAVMDRDAYDTFLEDLSDEQLKVSEFSDNRIKGVINAKEDGLMLTSIGYDKGWKAYVDGEETEVKTKDGAFLYIDMKAGVHDVELVYQTPGIAIGVIVSIISLGLLILLGFFGKKIGPYGEPEEEEDEPSEDDPEEDGDLAEDDDDSAEDDELPEDEELPGYDELPEEGQPGEGPGGPDEGASPETEPEGTAAEDPDEAASGPDDAGDASGI
ncbi:MAG: YfhO family protein [Lachnospiraceae bacterium]|nr:YfhO family protein [Lachnospiraceae bacterium]